MNETPCAKQARSPALRFRSDLIQLMAETCLGFILTCQCQEAPNVSFGDRPSVGRACGPVSPFSVKLFNLFDHFIIPWKLEVLTGALSAADRSYPTSDVRGRSREDPMPEGRRPRGATPSPRSGGCAGAGGPRGAIPRSRSGRAAVRRYPSSKVRSSGCALLEQP